MTYATAHVAVGCLPRKLATLAPKAPSHHLCIHCGWLGTDPKTDQFGMLSCPNCSWGLASTITRILVDAGGPLSSLICWLPSPVRGLDARLVVGWERRGGCRQRENLRYLRLFCRPDLDCVKNGILAGPCRACKILRGPCASCGGTGLAGGATLTGCRACGGTAINIPTEFR